MMFLLREFLAHPGRAVLIALGAIAGVLGLGMVVGHSGLAGVELIGTLVVAAGLLAMRVPRRVVLWLAAAAVVTVGVASVAPGVLAAGPLPVVVGILGLAGGLRVVSGLAGPPRPPASPLDARWATVRELRDAGFLTAHGWPLGVIGRHVIRFPALRERESIIVAAAPGSGKSAGLALPAILSEAEQPMAKRRSLVIVDPKDELTRGTLPTLAVTHRPLIWDPSQPNACTVGFDPLSTLPDPADERFVGEVTEVAQAWFQATRGGTGQSNDPFFERQPRSLMEALFLAFAVTHAHGTFVQLADWVRALSIDAFQDFLDQSTNPDVRASAEALRAVKLNERTIGPIYGDVLQRFDVLIDPRVRRAMSGTPIDWTAVIEQPTALYLRIAARDAPRLAPLVSMAIGQAYREVTTIAARHPDNVLPRELRLIVDEFGNLPQVHGIDVALATMRSYGVGHYLFVQNTGQIIHRYGRELGQSIQNSIVTKVMLGGAALDDAKAFSERCGEFSEWVDTGSSTWSGMLQRSTTRSHSPNRRPLISVTEIVHMSEVLVSTRGVMPICAGLRMYFKDKALMRRLKEDRREYYERRCPTSAAAVTPHAGAVPPSATVKLPPLVELPAQRSEKEVAAMGGTPPPPVAARPKGPRSEIPPPGCTAEEWATCSATLVTFICSAEDNLFLLVTGRIDSLEELRAIWQRDSQRSTPAQYANITEAERAQAPKASFYADELAVRLQLRDDEPTAASV